MINIAEIEKTALAATGGQWRQGQTHYCYQVIASGYHLFPDDPGFVEYVILDGNRNFPDDAKKNIAHAASANPATVLEMTQLIRELAGALDRVMATINDTPETNGRREYELAYKALHDATQAGVTDHIADVRHMVGTAEQSSAVAVPEGFDSAEMLDVAESLETHDKTRNVGNVTGMGDCLLETDTACAARFIRAVLAAATKQEGV